MDNRDDSKKADTNMIEIKRLLNYLVKNDYKFDEIEAEYDNDAVAIFSKGLSYYDIDDDWVKDSGIKISIQFEKRADYTNFEKNEEDENIYIGKPDIFIRGLITEIKSSKGGRAKCIKMKTRKNKSSKTSKTSKRLYNLNN